MARKPKQITLLSSSGPQIKVAGSIARLQLATKWDVSETLRISPETLKKYRLQEGSTLVEGLHYYILNRRTIRYNLELMVDWAINRNSPEIHQRTIELYLASLVTNQNKRGKRSHPTA